MRFEMGNRRTLLCSFAALLLTVAAPDARAGIPVLRLWPDVQYPCDSTLQACVAGAASGDEIRIASDGPIQESITFSKALTLRAQPGFAPLLGGDIAASTSGSGDQTIRIQGLTLLGSLEVDQNGTGSATIDIEDNTFEFSSSDSISVLADEATTGPVAFLVSGNTTLRGISVGPFTSAAHGSIERNTILMGSGAGSALVVTGLDHELTVDVIGNRISGSSYETGIALSMQGAGAVTARVLDNLVTGQSPAAGHHGIAAYPSPSGMLDIAIVNNTIADTGYGIRANSGSAEITGVIANNAITGSNFGLSIEAATVSNQNNLFFGNASDFDFGAAGPGSVFADPRYAGGSDYRVRPGSPAIDAGDDDSVPADLTGDLEGGPRIQGSHVDIGAYEAPEAAGPLPAVAGLSALALLALRRRWSGA
jgi:hypothetical protein